MPPRLYDIDFAEWAEKTAQLLQERRFSEIDLDNLIEEIQALSRSDRREIRSRLIQLLSHLLKCAYQPEKLTDSWLNTIAEQRRQIGLILEDSLSLRNYFSEVFTACYEKARTEATRETKLLIKIFPEVCPFTEDNVLDGDWLP